MSTKLNVSYAQLALLYVYLAAVAIPIVWFDAGLWSTAIIFWLLPTLFVIRMERFPKSLLLGILFFSVAHALFWQAVGYINGAWYELSSTGIRILGHSPIDMYFWAFLYVFFIIVMYEYFFDDTIGSPIVWNQKNKYLYIFTIIIPVCAFVYTYLLSDIFVPYAYATLLSITIVSLIVLAMIAHKHSWRVLKKTLLFSLFMLPLSLLHEYISIVNVHWLFANETEYIMLLPYAGEYIPIEEIGFIFLVPLWITTIYEFYLDDAR